MIYKAAKQTKTVSITSGKGGVGKTSVLSNLAYSLALKGKKVLIFDGDLGMSNIDILFGVKPKGHILEVINGEKSLSEIITPLFQNISLISGGSGITQTNKLSAFERRSLLDSVQQTNANYDYLLIDTAPGITENVLYLNAAAQVASVIITPDPTSFADAYALIKVLNAEYKENNFSIICNQVKDEADGLSLFNRFQEVVDKFLCVSLDHWGSLSYDANFKMANRTQRLILRQDPFCPTSKQLQKITSNLELALGAKQDAKPGLQFFFEQVVGVA